MAHHNIQSLLSYHCLTAPLDPSPASDLDKMINELRVKYRTYLIELDVEYGAVMLPMMFAHDFGDQIDLYATLVDPNNNEFEVLVERNNQGIYLTKGWHAIRDFYNIQFGAWVTIVFLGFGKFNIRVKNRFGKTMRYPIFTPPMKFRVEKNSIPVNLANVVPRPFVHDEMNFQLTYEKRIAGDEINAGFLEIAYFGFSQLALDRGTTAIALVDENGNIWDCTLQFCWRPDPHFKIGGDWDRMVKARRLREGAVIMIGAPGFGFNETLYICFLRY